KAELGILTQVDLDKTINIIRDRVGMPPTVLGEFKIDQNLLEEYPNVTESNRDIILEIRRERRIELACEGFRKDDLFRWKAGHLLEKAQHGVYISQFGLHDFTGDGVPDIGFFKSKNENT